SPALPALAPEHERLRLYDAVAELCLTIAARGALVLALDDLQWADAATWELLLYLLRRLRAAPLLVLGAYREGEVEEQPHVRAALAELNRRRLLLTVPLRPLGEADSG